MAKDGTSEWAALAEEEEIAKNWQSAADSWQSAATEAMGYDIRDEYIRRRDLAERKAVKAKAAEWKPEASQEWMGVKDD